MINKTFRLFISSTFNDFQTERAIINRDILSELDLFCKQYGYRFQIIELRWGVNTESALNQNTVDICIDEVKRSKNLSPRPNFLIMVGERYGWIPLPSRINKIVFEQLLEVATNIQIEALSAWYIFDGNQIGGEYYLRSRTDKYEKDQEWKIIEDMLRQILLSCASKTGLVEDDHLSLSSSATELEIVEGLFNDSDNCEGVIAYFRSGCCDEEKEEDLLKTNDLKERIRDRLTKDGNSDNIIELKHSESRDYLAKFKEIIITKLKENILIEIEKLEKDSSTVKTLDILTDKYCAFNTFRSRQSELGELFNYANSANNAPLLLTGEYGCGKSTLLADFAGETELIVFPAFFGLDEKSYTLYEVLEGICDEIKLEFNITRSDNITEYNIAQVFSETINSVPDNQKIVIIIDGLDMFYDISSIHENILPSILPKNIKLIVSAFDTSIIDNLFGGSIPFISINSFSSQECKDYFDSLLKEKNRQIINEKQNDAVRDSIVSGATPLYVRLLSEICSKWHSSDVVQALPKTIENLVTDYYSDIILKRGHNESLLYYALALVSASPFGITEEELQVLLLRIDAVETYFKSEDRYTEEDSRITSSSDTFDRLPFVIWSRLFYDLKGCLSLTVSHGTVVVNFVHNIFRRVFVDNYSHYCDECFDKLVSYYLNQDDYYDIEEKMPNNRKALSIPSLLKVRNKFRELAELYSNDSFVDSVVRIGNVNEAIKDIRLLLGNSCVEEFHEELQKVLFCLNNNRVTLNCYYANYYSCAIECNLIKYNEASPAIYTIQGIDDKEYTIFPYSAKSKIVWDPDAIKYAVLSDSSIYICEFPQGMELCRIIIHKSEAESVVTIENAIWLNKETLAVVTNDRIIVFDIINYLPTEIYQCKCDSSIVKYDYISHILFFAFDDYLHAIDTNDYSEIYTLNIHPKYKECKVFDIIPGKTKLLIRKNHSFITIYNAKTGEVIKNKYVKSGYGDLIELELSNIHYLYADNVLLHKNICNGENANSFRLISLDNKKMKWLLPPLINYYQRILLGNKFLILIWESTLVSISMYGNMDIKKYELDDLPESVFWRKNDEILSITTLRGLISINLSEFENLSEKVGCCRTGKHNYLESLFVSGRPMFARVKKLIDSLRNLILGYSVNMFEYRTAFSDTFYNESENSIFINENNEASLVVFAPNGTKAVAYESNDSICVFNDNHTMVLHIDKLNLSISNGILGLAFSIDSKLLLIWRNFSIQVISIKKGKIVFDFDLAHRAALCARFSDTDPNILIITMSNGSIYYYDLSRKSFIDAEPPKKLPDSAVSDAYFGPFYYKSIDGKLVTFRLLDDILWGESPNKWMTKSRVYHNNEIQLFYYDGQFYYGTEKENSFLQPFFDFKKSLQFERAKDSTPIKSFLREKNDLFSSLVEIKQGKLYILISRMLNSVILLDYASRKIIAAYKHHGNIIGYRMIKNNELELVSDRHPFTTRLRIRI